MFFSLNLFLFIHNLEIKGELWDYWIQVLLKHLLYVQLHMLQGLNFISLDPLVQEVGRDKDPILHLQKEQVSVNWIEEF